MLKEITVASALVALFVLSGCGGGGGTPPGGGNPPDTGIEIPSELTKKADINETTSGEYLRKYNDTSGPRSSMSIKDTLGIKSSIDPTRVDPPVSVVDKECSISGSFSYKRDSNTYTEGNLTIQSSVEECSAVNCIMKEDDIDDGDNQYVNNCRPTNRYTHILGGPGDDDDRRYYNGTIKSEIISSRSTNRDDIPNIHKIELKLKVENLTYKNYSNSSEDENYRFYNGEYSYSNAGVLSSDDFTTIEFETSNLIFKNYDRNRTNNAQIFNGEGYKAEFDIKIITNEDRVTHKIQRTINKDGYGLFYDVSGTESNKTVLSNSFAYDNYVKKISTAGDLTTIDVAGGINEHPSCGMYQITTDKIVKHNKTFSISGGFDEDDVLPYVGKVTLKGNGTAVATFDKRDGNKTFMTLKIDGAETEYGEWDDVPNYDDCDDD